MTRGPRATLGTPVAVELPRPRSASDLIHDDHAAHVRAHVVESLTEDLERSRRGTTGRAARAARSARRAATALRRRTILAAVAEAGAKDDRAARTHRADEGVRDADRAVRRRQGRQRADPARRVRLHPRPLRLRQIDRAVDHRRPRAATSAASSSTAGGRRTGSRARAGVSVAVPAAVADAREATWSWPPIAPPTVRARSAEARRRVLSRSGRRARCRRSAAGRAVARHAAVRVAGARAVARAAVPAARRAVLACSIR